MGATSLCGGEVGPGSLGTPRKWLGLDLRALAIGKALIENVPIVRTQDGAAPDHGHRRGSRSAGAGGRNGHRSGDQLPSFQLNRKAFYTSTGSLDFVYT
jgi:hypothetical protein